MCGGGRRPAGDGEDRRFKLDCERNTHFPTGGSSLIIA